VRRIFHPPFKIFGHRDTIGIDETAILDLGENAGEFGLGVPLVSLEGDDLLSALAG